jgi:hypothetical protein
MIEGMSRAEILESLPEGFCDDCWQQSVDRQKQFSTDPEKDYHWVSGKGLPLGLLRDTHLGRNLTQRVHSNSHDCRVGCGPRSAGRQGRGLALG